MYKITIQDQNLNDYIFYKLDEEVDIFIEWGIRDKLWGDIEIFNIIKEELTFEQIEALKYLESTDWYAIRKIDTGQEIPEDIVILRQAARDLL